MLEKTNRKIPERAGTGQRVAVLENGISGNDRRAGTNRNWESTDRVCREKSRRQVGCLKSSSFGYISCRGLVIGQRSSIPKRELTT